VSDRDSINPGTTGHILWTPSEGRLGTANIFALCDQIEEDWNVTVADFDAVHAFSVAAPEKFWQSVRDDCAIIAETWGDRVLENPDTRPGGFFGARWFPDAKLNYAENLLRRRDDADAIVFWGEDKARRRLSHRRLYDQVSRTAQALTALGVGVGDRVAGYMPNMPETVIAMLATAAIGAVWSSASPDFGADGLLDRFGQIEPKVLFAVDGYFYNGKAHDCRNKIAAVAAKMPSLQAVVVVPYADPAPNLAGIGHAVRFETFLSTFKADDIAFRRLPFNHPLFILFSSGTTGKPKCIVHGAGGTLIQHMKEHRYHCDIKPDDRVFYFTTCGWMMWNWLVSALASQATLLLYDGAPFYPDGNVLFDYADAEGMTFFGTSAKYIDALSKSDLAKAGLSPAESHDLKSLRALASTGSPLMPAAFDYVYDHIKSDLHLASISGGTDIISCFVLGNPTAPVRRGEIQAAGLGMAVEVFDDQANSVTGEKGELVCTKPFPSMPVAFWNDTDGARYRSAYFERFPDIRPGIWHHGDFIERTANGGFIIHGRSDATLNPGGVRIGTAEIYRQVEKLDAVKEAIVVGQDWQGDVRVILFVVMQPGHTLDDATIKTIKARIRETCTPRHVPAKIIAVTDIPRTKSGKITELAVRDVIHGRGVENTTALANPDALDQFRDLEELKR